MVKAVLIQNDGSQYRDEPGVRYHFPNRRLLRWAVQAQGDWVLLYRGRRGGAEGYFGVQRASKVVADPVDPASSYLLLDPASELSFEQVVPRLRADRTPHETGLPLMGGFNTQAIRIISDLDFAAIVTLGLRAATIPETLPREGRLPGWAEEAACFDGAPTIRERELTSRAFRDATFARQVKTAYAARCAMSGLSLRNGGGRPEVEAAHIRSVEAGGPDVVRNGLALSGTLHWMFDRGLVSVDEDHSILIARDSIAGEVADRLLTADRRLILPPDPTTRPHPAYLAWHRRTVFKR